MAYVFVQHLDPHHESALVPLLARATRLPVAEAKDAERLQPDRVYVIPPQMDLLVADSSLRLQPRGTERDLHMPIDLFMRSLAMARGSRAIGVVLSGTGTDGTLGLKAIKIAGGITLSQEPTSARYDGMPRSAIGAGCVDFVLPPQAIAHELARFARHPYVQRTHDDASLQAPAEAAHDSLTAILTQLRKASGTDFSSYRQTTLLRRLSRRMALHRLESLEDYADYLAKSPKEVQELHDDVLINVTSFFRDPGTFEALTERVLPRLMSDRTGDGPVRVWVPGCATGEEAYSIAICLLEATAGKAQSPGIQVFASDLSKKAVGVARAGFYLDSIAGDVSPERLADFFTKAEGGYRVSKAVRDVCVFAQQDMTRDPPFSRLDLVSCRNTLIYLDAPMQRRVLAVFHHALSAGGFLILGPAEMVGTPSASLFTEVDRQHKVYIKRPAANETLFALASSRAVAESSTRERPAAAPPKDGNRSLAEGTSIDHILAERYAPAGVLVDQNLEILEFRGDTSAWLRNLPGAASLNLARMARAGVATDVLQAVRHAARTGKVVSRQGLLRQHPGADRRFDVDVIPLQRPTEGTHRFLVLFRLQEPARPSPQRVGRAVKGASAKDRQIEQLEAELQSLRQAQQSLAQDNEAAMEELQSANEEILSSNEELQSINEELETAKEELQSSNEELTTLNEELQNRNAELGRLSDDLTNLLDSVDMPIVMLGRDLRLRRFTSSAGRLLHLIAADVGRPFSDLRPTLEVPELQRLLRAAIEDLTGSEAEVRDQTGHVYSLRIRPYRTADDRIDGAVMAIVDIDALQRASTEVAAARDLADAMVDTVRQGLLILDADLRVERANWWFYEIFQVTPEETLARRLFELGDGAWNIAGLASVLPQTLHAASQLRDFEVEQEFPRIGRRVMRLNGRALRQKSQGSQRILLAIEDVTEQKAAEATREQLTNAERQRETEVEASRLKDEFVATISHELRGPLSSIAAWVHVLSTGKADRPTQEQALVAIDRGVKAEARLIDDLLDLSRILAGKITLSRGIVDLVPITEAVIETVRAAAEAKEIQMEMIKTGKPALVRGDPDRLQQIIWNLASNAVKFTPPRGLVRVSIERDESLWEIRVADTGVGISPTFLPYVFERFKQADEGATRKPGLGLGLAIVRHLVELHGGEVDASSEGEGKGAVFTVHLPIPALIVPRDALEQANASLPPLEQMALAGTDVLLVEDDADAREALVSVLEHYGARVTAAGSVADALKALAQSVPDLLVSDLGMPGRDGYDLIRAVRALPPDQGGRVPALALSAYASPQDRDRAITAGFHRHVAKPAEPPDLVATLVQLLRAIPPR
jgi:two-component system CheB/CheR fusion protein